MSGSDEFSTDFNAEFSAVAPVTVASVQALLATAKSDLASIQTAMTTLANLLATIDTDVGKL